MEEQRWRGRRGLAAVVRAAIFALPLGASVGAGAVVSRVLPHAHGWAAAAFWWVALLSIVTFVMVVVERMARRLLPLAALLKLSLIFPDRAPSRFRMAMRAGGTRKLEQRLAAASDHGLPDTPAEAAEKVLELAALLNVHDRRTRGHSERVRVYSDLLADELGLSAHERSRLHWAALLHDIGKLVVPGHILNKAGAPSEDEWEVLRRHPLEGERFVEPLRSWLGDWAAAIGEHHERYGGGGYPRGLSGQQISYAARIVAVADAYEVMTAARAYKKPLPAPEARRELARCAGSQFDPLVVRAFLNISLGRLRLAMGPLAWLAQIPVVAQMPALGATATSTVGSAAAGIATSTAIVLGGVAEVPHVDLAPPVPITAPTAVAAAPVTASTAAPASTVITTAATATSSMAPTAPPPSLLARDGQPQQRPPAPATTTTSAPTTSAEATTATTARPATTVVTMPAAPVVTAVPAMPSTTKPPGPSNDSEADDDQGIGNDDDDDDGDDDDNDNSGGNSGSGGGDNSGEGGGDDD